MARVYVLWGSRVFTALTPSQGHSADTDLNWRSKKETPAWPLPAASQPATKVRQTPASSAPASKERTPKCTPSPKASTRSLGAGSQGAGGASSASSSAPTAFENHFPPLSPEKAVGGGGNGRPNSRGASGRAGTRRGGWKKSPLKKTNPRRKHHAQSRTNSKAAE